MTNKATITLNPDDLSPCTWNELFYAADCLGLPTDGEFNQPLERSAEDVESAALCCRNKAERIKAGELGPEPWPGDDAKWIADLEAAAEYLEGLVAAQGVL